MVHKEKALNSIWSLSDDGLEEMVTEMILNN